MNKFIALGCIAACSVVPALADDHGSESMGNGAFTTLFVSTKDVENYINSVKSSTALFETIGSNAAGYCETISGRDEVGQVMIWNAFGSVTDALVGGSKYDASKAPADMAGQRDFKYTATRAPLKTFPRLDPGYERAMRIKLKPENLPAFIAAITKMEAEIIAAGHKTFMNGLFVAIGGGTTEAGTFYLKSITSSVETHGAVIDDYFAGASWGATYNEASAMIDEIVNDQFEICEQFYTAE